MTSAVADSPHIYTLTGNLLAERTLEFDGWSTGRTQRARRETFQVGGKGINVSRMLNRLGAANTALCFAGGPTGDECERWLREREFNVRAFRSSRATRLGTVVRDASGAHAETTFLGPDAAPDAAAVKACADFLDAQPDGHVLALCGSFPGWSEVHFDPLRAAFERWLGRGILVADTYGPPLAWAAQRTLSLIKINAEEFEAWRAQSGQAGFAPPPRSWVVTDGPRPIRLRDETGATHVLSPPVVREVSPTGSGDVLLACILHGITSRGLGVRAAVVRALPYAAANSAHPGVAEFELPG